MQNPCVILHFIAWVGVGQGVHLGRDCRPGLGSMAGGNGQEGVSICRLGGKSVAIGGMCCECASALGFFLAGAHGSRGEHVTSPRAAPQAPLAGERHR